MTPIKAQKTTFRYAIIVLASSVFLLELISFCSTGWMRLEGNENPEGQLTEDRTRNRRSYGRQDSGNSYTGSHLPLGKTPSTSRPPIPSKDPVRPISGDQYPATRRPRPTKRDPNISYPPRPTRGQIPGRTKFPPQNRPRPTKRNPNISYPPRPTRGPLPGRTKIPSQNRTRPTKKNPYISYPPRPTGWPFPGRTKIPSQNRTRPTKQNPNISYPRRPTRGPLPGKSKTRLTPLPNTRPVKFWTRSLLFTRRPYSSPPSRRPSVTRPPRYSLKPGQSPGPSRGTRFPGRKPVTRTPVLNSSLKPNKIPKLSAAEIHFITNLIGQINATWPKNRTVKFIKEHVISSGLNFSNPYGIDLARIVTLFNRSGYDEDTMRKDLVLFQATLNPGASTGDLIPGLPRLPNSGNKPTGSGDLAGGKGTGGVSDGQTDEQDSGSIVAIEIGLWTAVICREEMRTGETVCERTHDNFSGILHDRAAWSMIDIRIEAVFAITFGMIGSLCSVLIVNPWCLKQKHRLLLIGGICGLTISGLLYFITIGRVVAIKGTFEQEADRDYSNLKVNTPWCLYIGGLGAGLAFVTSGFLATIKWAESRKAYAEFGNEVVFTREADKPATEADVTV